MLKPESEAALADAIKRATGPLCIRGGGTRGLAVDGETLDTTALTGITRYEPGALTMVAHAGTSLREIEAALDAERQMLAFEPFDLSSVTGGKGPTTIGGIFATNASGSRRVQSGAARDYLLGVRFVDGAGNIIKNGGRVMKNVTGYDLVKLMAGSHGTLGVLTEVSFKVLPKPEAVSGVTIEGLPDVEAVRAMSKALCSPYDITGAMHLPKSNQLGEFTHIRVEGFSDSVKYRAEQLRTLLGEFGEVKTTQDDSAWKTAGMMTAFKKTKGAEPGALWRLALKPSDSPKVVEDVARQHDCRVNYDWGGGRVWVWAGAGTDTTSLHDTLQEAARKAGGHATLVYASTPIEGPRFQPEPPIIASLTAGLRAKFDPRGILNPGVMA